MTQTGRRAAPRHDPDARARALGARWLRAFADLGRPELARRSGISESTLHRFEKGGTSPGPEDLDTLLEAVELPVPRERFLDWCREATGTAGAGGDLAALLARRHPLSRPLPETLPTAEDRAAVPDLWRRFQPLSREDRPWLIRATREFRNQAFAEHLCAESRRALAEDPGQALELAELALLVAVLIPGEQAWSWRLEGLALTHVADARQGLGDPDAASRARARGRELWQKGARADAGLLGEVRP